MITAQDVKEAIDNLDRVRYDVNMLLYTEALKGNEYVELSAIQDRDIATKIIKRDKLGKIEYSRVSLNPTIYNRAKEIDKLLENRMLEFNRGHIRVLKETKCDKDIFTIRGFIVTELQDNETLEISLPIKNSVYPKFESKK